MSKKKTRKLELMHNYILLQNGNVNQKSSTPFPPKNTQVSFNYLQRISIYYKVLQKIKKVQNLSK